MPVPASPHDDRMDLHCGGAEDGARRDRVESSSHAPSLPRAAKYKGLGGLHWLFASAAPRLASGCVSLGDRVMTTAAGEVT